MQVRSYSPNSAVQTFTTVCCTTPGTPTAVSGAATGPTTANLSWAAGANAGSPTVTYYWSVGTNPAGTCAGGSTVTTTYNSTGGLQTFTVPAGITSVTVDVQGAQGGGVSGYDTYQSNGGNGGRVQATVAVTAGHVLNIYVGAQGSQTGTGGYWGGGSDGNFTSTWPGAGGGGASTISDNTSSTLLVLAGGGGGGGGDLAGSDNGGVGGGTTGGNGVSSSCTTGGTGGTPAAGGTGEVCTYTGSNGTGPATFNSIGSGGASAPTNGSEAEEEDIMVGVAALKEEEDGGGWSSYTNGVYACKFLILKDIKRKWICVDYLYPLLTPVIVDSMASTTGTSATTSALTCNTTYYLSVYAKTSCDGSSSACGTSGCFFLW